MSQSPSVLVVGGAGYLGCVLVNELLAKNYSVTVFDRLFFGDLGLQKVRDRIRVIPGDIRTMSDSVLKNINAIINLAGLSNDPTAEYHPFANYQMNSVATRKLAEMAKAVGIRRYIYASSCSVYDAGLKEASDELLTEDAEIAPRGAYACSKFDGEQRLLELADDGFCAVSLRMGTLFGFSGRMRYDLVVNTFIKDAMMKGQVTLHHGGQMWRPLIEVRDAARAYIVVLESPERLVASHVFNLVYENFVILEVAFRVCAALREIGIPVSIEYDYQTTGIRNYRVSGKKITQVLGFQSAISIEESVKDMVNNIRASRYTNFDHDRYYNIRWLRLLEEVKSTIDLTGTLFEIPEGSQGVSTLISHNKCPNCQANGRLVDEDRHTAPVQGAVLQ